jgi:hypothetical protein
MPLLAINASKKVTITCSLEEATAKLVDKYAYFLKVPADDVVDRSLAYVFNKDKDFQQYLASNGDAHTPSALRVKKPIPSASGTKNGSKPVLGDAK